MKLRTCSLALVAAAALAGIAGAADHPVAGKKLVVVDRRPAGGTAKTVFLAKDPAVTKGVGVDAARIDARLDLIYDDARGGFEMPAGDRWRANTAAVARYLHRDAPEAGEVKSALVKPGKLLKVVAQGTGDVPLDLTAAPIGPVYVVHTVHNADEESRHCTQFTECTHRLLPGGGAKLVCRNGVGDPDCAAALPCGFTDLGATVLDTCADLEWEKKTTEPGSGSNGADLHDVDNKYPWAGRCSLALGIPCQPNVAAAATCAAQTSNARGCGLCGATDGFCNVDPLGNGAITTVWDWVNQLNAVAFAGHTDWRLPTSAGGSLFPTGQPAELESILDPTVGNCGGVSGPVPCIDPVFGPTFFGGYWTASPEGLPSSTSFVYGVFFSPGGVFSATTNNNLKVRAVRVAS